MSTIGGRDPARGRAQALGAVVLGMAVALGVFIQLQSQEPRPPEDLPRAIALPALYATIGLLAIIGASQRRPAIVVAAGLLCILGAVLSVATFAFAIPGVLLTLFGTQIQAPSPRKGSDTVIAAVVALLVVSGAVALLALTTERCWQATGSPAGPTYAVVPCGDQGGSVGGGQVGAGQAYASGSDSGALTTGGGWVEGVLLAGALMLAAVTGRQRTRSAVQ